MADHQDILALLMQIYTILRYLSIAAGEKFRSILLAVIMGIVIVVVIAAFEGNLVKYVSDYFCLGIL